MKRILNKRLDCLSAFIRDNEKIIDIGCDHGLLGIYLYLNRKNMKIISSDINSGPLKKAQDNLEKYGLENKIELRLGNGLMAMDDDTNTVIISGMGGITMMDILSDIQKYPNVSKIVLSPNNEFTYVRRKMYQYGFTPQEEKIILEKEKYYLVSVFIKKKEKIDSFFGKLDLSDKEVISYYQRLYLNNQNILKRLSFWKKMKRFDLIKENYQIKKRLKISFNK